MQVKNIKYKWKQIEYFHISKCLDKKQLTSQASLPSDPAHTAVTGRV